MTQVSSRSVGECDAAFAPVMQLFDDYLEADPLLSAQLVVFHEARRVVDLCGGDDVEPDGLQGIFSSSKGVSGTAIALLVRDRVLNLRERVAHYWPDFADGGKEEVTVACALSHQAGLIGVYPRVNFDELLDHEYMAKRLAAAVPSWRPGAGHGYHGFTIGVLMDELVRRVTGQSLAEFFRKEIADPFGLDVFVSTRNDIESRVKPVLLDGRDAAAARDSARVDPEQTSTIPAPAILSVPLMARFANERAARAAGLPAAGAVASARGLAALYALATTGLGAEPLLDPTTLAVVTQTQTIGEDLALGIPTRYAIVFQKPSQTHRYGSYLAFGHDGAGGSLGLADPMFATSFAYIPRRMPDQLGADPRAVELAAKVRACARELC